MLAKNSLLARLAPSAARLACAYCHRHDTDNTPKARVSIRPIVPMI
jgi:hypothetical protein